ncbi:CsgG/HfaB family protein [Desulfovibrio mangrovi]|uniref:CsgG/HfaB family protein n=1 Tax=Desulfovibrio mangrovi TaxID=2976983 RepID=UPI002248559F|nr:CsgG/HfaB family protein [Desulfovibrio mangrovi]UZP65965.1 CsgG/HfaB family protein [Desulfovibrio mangrovi]
MHSLLKYAAALLSIMALCSCATVKKPEKIETTAPKQVVSPAVAAEQKEQYKGLKRKVAIARFSNETKYGQSFFLDDNNDRIGKQAVDILSNKLMETEKFVLLERADLDKIQKELGIGDAAPLKNMADYLIVGSITEFGRKETGDVGLFSRTKKQVAYAKVHIRLIDVYTGEVIYSEAGEGEAFSEAGSIMGFGARTGYDSAINDKAIDAAITDLASNLIENLMNKPWRSYILSHEEGMYIMGGGASQGIKVGDQFDVIAEGKKVKNPQTNTMITLPGKKVAAIKVLQTSGSTPADEISFCQLTSGDLSAWNASKDYSPLFIQATAR